MSSAQDELIQRNVRLVDAIQQVGSEGQGRRAQQPSGTIQTCLWKQCRLPRRMRTGITDC